MTANKPTVEELGERLGVKVDDLPWQTSGQGTGMFQVAIVRPHEDPHEDPRDEPHEDPRGDSREGDDEVWVLVRLQGGSDVQVYDRREWECWLDGVHRGEFDDLL